MSSLHERIRDAVGQSSTSCDDVSEGADEGFETPDMDEFLAENQAVDDL